jgi:NAD/NADP transhydrogenase beta subunit
MSPIVASVAGAVVGAGVAVAAVVLSNEKNRKKMKDLLTGMKNKATGHVEDVQKKTQEKIDEAEVKIAEGKNKAAKIGITVEKANKKIKSIWRK